MYVLVLFVSERLINRDNNFSGKLNSWKSKASFSGEFTLQFLFVKYGNFKETTTFYLIEKETYEHPFKNKDNLHK